MKNEDILKAAPPGSILLFKKLTFVDTLIRLAQSVKSGRPSEWSHCAIKTADNTVIESDFYIRGLRVYNGGMESRLEKYKNPKKIANIACIECILDQATIDRVTVSGRRLIRKKLRYAASGLLGTLINILRLRLSSSGTRLQRIRREKNPFFQQNTMYCAHFVLSCFKAAGIDLLPHINHSVATVEDLYRTKVRQSFMIKKRIGE